MDKQSYDPSPTKSDSSGHSLMDPPGYIKPDLQDLPLTDITAKEPRVIAEAKMSQVNYTPSWGSEDYPSLYDRHTRHMMSAHIRDALLLANLIPGPSIPSNKKLLDMACGTGALTFEATRLGITDVTSTDFAQGMLDKLIEKAAEASPPIHVQTVLDDGQTLSKFEDASFDAVCSSFGIFLFEDRIAGYKSAARVLKPGGTFVTTSWVPQKGLMGYNSEIFRRAGLSLPPVLDPIKNATLSAQGFLDEVQSIAMFENVHVYRVSHELVLLKGSHLLDVYEKNPVFLNIVQALGGRDKLACVLADITSEEKGKLFNAQDFINAPFQTTTECFICVATRLKTF